MFGDPGDDWRDDDPANDPGIEMIVHCDLCGASWDLDGNGEGLVLNGQKPLFDRQIPEQIKLCIECAIQAAAAVERLIQESDICEHGVPCGDWCEPCNREYKRCAEELNRPPNHGLGGEEG